MNFPELKFINLLSDIILLLDILTYIFISISNTDFFW